MTVGPNNVLYVDNVDGNDATAVRGNYSRPYLTIQAALDAMLTDDVVHLAPQKFTITAPLTIPSTVLRATISGWGGDTNFTAFAAGPRAITQIIQATDNADCFDLGANPGLTRLVIRGMVIQPLANGTSTGSAIKADGSLYAVNTFLAEGLQLSNVELTAAQAGFGLNLKYVRRLKAINCVWAAPMSFVTCGDLELVSVQGPSCTVLHTYDITDPLRPTRGTLSVVGSSRIGGNVLQTTIVTLGGVARLFVDRSSIIGGLKGAGLVASGTNVPSVIVNGAILGFNGGVVDFASGGAELPDTATAITMDFRNAALHGTAANFKVAGAASPQTVRMDTAAALAGLALLAGEGINLIARGMAGALTYATPGVTGSIIPPFLAGNVDISAGGAVAKTWAAMGFAALVRVGTATYDVQVQSNIQGADVAVPIAGQVTTGITITSTAQPGNTAAKVLVTF